MKCSSSRTLMCLTLNTKLATFHFSREKYINMGTTTRYIQKYVKTDWQPYLHLTQNTHPPTPPHPRKIPNLTFSHSSFLSSPRIPPSPPIGTSHGGMVDFVWYSGVWRLPMYSRRTPSSSFVVVLVHSR